MKIYLMALVLFGLALPPLTSGDDTPGSPRPELTVEMIMRDPLWIGSSPTEINWSPDSKTVYFKWNRHFVEAGDSLYSVARNGGEISLVDNLNRPAPPYADGEFSKEFDRMVYSTDGDLLLVEVKSGAVRQLTRTNDWQSNPQFTRDEQGVTFTEGNDLYQLDLKTGELIQLTDFRAGKERDDDKQWDRYEQGWDADELALISQLAEKKVKREKEKSKREEREAKQDRPLEIYLGEDRVTSPELSPDRQYVTYIVREEFEKRPGTIIPRYVTESGYTDSFDSRSKVGSTESRQRLGIYDIVNDTAYYASLDSLPGIFDEPAYRTEYDKSDSTVEDSSSAKEEPQVRDVWFARRIWSDDGQQLLVDLRAGDYKERWLALVDLKSGAVRCVDRQHDDAWVGGPAVGWRNATCGWLDKGTIWFLSEQSGYSHLYTANIENGGRQQWTSGNFEVSSISLSPDKKFWYFLSNERAPGLRCFYRVNTSSGVKEQITKLGGNCAVTISPDYKFIAISRSNVTEPAELYLQENRPGAEAIKITHSVTDQFLSYPWRVPEVITFAAQDSATVYANLYAPDHPVPGAPAVIFVHGAGYLQNVRKAWGHYYREFMFHNLLADRGYYVLDIDYRGSAGYGRDWRTGIYRHMGGKDLTDQVDGARYLVEQYGVDSTRIGIYGGSYGGFITLMAMFTEPHAFAAGAALRSVTDWAHYNHGYTAAILNVPVLDSLAYVQSSPIYFAEGFEGHLLMCHGMLDDNVHFQDIVRLSQRLIELGKENWELAVYPLESHSFIEPAAWTDEYQRILKLFETQLRNRE